MRAEADTDGERWIRVERPEATVRYRLDARGRIQVRSSASSDERQIRTVIEEYARATPGRVLPARRQHDHAGDPGPAPASPGRSSGKPTAAWSTCGSRRRWELVAGKAAGSRALRLEVFAHQLL